MHKQQITIEIDIPDGFEATGEFRIPDERNEYWLSSGGELCGPHNGMATVCGNRIILRKIWEWPTWLKMPYIAMDKDGLWFAYSCMPMKNTHRWYTRGIARSLPSDCFDFIRPPCTDWTLSLYRNPNINEQ